MSIEFTGAELDTLIGLVRHGPLFDGDLPSKTGRNSLVDRGFAARIRNKGQSGYNAVTDAGCAALAQYFEVDTADEALAKLAAAHA